MLKNVKLMIFFIQKSLQLTVLYKHWPSTSTSSVFKSILMEHFKESKVDSSDK